MATFAPVRSAFAPPVPQDFKELGISESLVLDLMLRRLLIEGFSSIAGIAKSLRLSHRIVDIVFKHMRSQQLVEVKGMIGNDYSFTLSGAGKQLAGERFQISQYAGACPVSLADYHDATKVQSAHVHVDRKTLRAAYSDLIVTDRMLDQLGPAIISQNSIFVYGPTGNGKTSLAERMLRVYKDAVLIPYAVEVDNQVISLYDPVVHQPIEHDNDDIDPRWLLCKRPCIVVGGELIPSMLELRLDEASGIYAAPLQMKANNGILIIDDFGRQLMSPRDLLNRWIVPLDRRVDYLTLRYGVKFQIPFELMVVFSTNLEPADLADEAFLRRIHNKIFVEAVDAGSFDQIFHRVVASRNITAEPDSAEFLRKLCLREGRTELRACYPADICNILMAIGRYEGRGPVMTKSEIERAASLYFAKSKYHRPMASRQATVDFIVDQISSAGAITTKRMFGEYCIYCKGKVAAFVCDDKLFVKPTPAGKAYAPDIGEGHPYPGAKPYLLIPGERWEDADWLSGLIRASLPDLPAPKPKPARKKR